MVSTRPTLSLPPLLSGLSLSISVVPVLFKLDSTARFLLRVGPWYALRVGETSPFSAAVLGSPTTFSADHLLAPLRFSSPYVSWSGARRAPSSPHAGPGFLVVWLSPLEFERHLAPGFVVTVVPGGGCFSSLVAFSDFMLGFRKMQRLCISPESLSQEEAVVGRVTTELWLFSPQFDFLLVFP